MRERVRRWRGGGKVDRALHAEVHLPFAALVHRRDDANEVRVSHPDLPLDEGGRPFQNINLGLSPPTRGGPPRARRTVRSSVAMPSVARPSMWESGQVSSRFPKPMTTVRARPVPAFKPPKEFKVTPTIMDADWRPSLLSQADAWEAEVVAKVAAGTHT